MSGHGNREATLRANGLAWRDRVTADVESERGRAVADAHRVEPELVGEAVALIAAYIAVGEVAIGRRDLPQQVRRVMAYLEARGHIERVDRDLIRPVSIRPSELPLA
jgi:hypothetical protein